MGEFRMPALGADMEHGTIVEWLVAPGDIVHRGDVVAVVDTEKSTLEVEIFEEGTIEELLVPVGEEVPIGAALARVGAGAPLAAVGAGPLATRADRAAARPAPAAIEGSDSATHESAPAVFSPMIRRLAAERHVDLAHLHGSGRNGVITRADVEHAASPAAPCRGKRPRSSPYARRLANERGVDLHDLVGSGPGGAIVAADLERVGDAPSSAAAPVTRAVQRPEPRAKSTDKSGAMQRSIGALMQRAKREIPHYYVRTTIDMHTALSWLSEHNSTCAVDERLLPAALLLKATALAAAEQPAMNGFYRNGGFTPSDHVHLGVAISMRGGGLIAPAVHDADRLPLLELMAAIADLVARSRRGSLRSSEMADPTITVTNLGDQGVEEVYGVIYPPQVALVGFGKIVDRPWAVDGMLTVRPTVVVTLSADHRVSNGHAGGRFLDRIDRLLQEPEKL